MFTWKSDKNSPWGPMLDTKFIAGITITVMMMSAS